MSDCVIVLMLV